jgi:hypothetical protein
MLWEKGGWRLAAVAAYVAWLAQTPACASPWTLKDHRYVDRESGASVEAPGGAWRSVDVDGALLSFADGSGARLSWIRQCGRVLPEPRIAARELLIGLDVQGPVEGGAATVDGAPAWELRAEVRDDGHPAWIESVTRVGGRCTDDFVLVAPRPAPAQRTVFERWWRSFREGSGAAPDAGRTRP